MFLILTPIATNLSRIFSHEGISMTIGFAEMKGRCSYFTQIAQRYAEKSFPFFHFSRVLTLSFCSNLSHLLAKVLGLPYLYKVFYTKNIGFNNFVLTLYLWNYGLSVDFQQDGSKVFSLDYYLQST